MANANDLDAVYRENLADAGLDPAEIESCMEMLLNDEREKLCRSLYTQRSLLLEELHACSKRIDCLDYFIRMIKKL